MKTLRHKCKIVLSIFVSILLMVVSISASLAEGEIKTLTAILIEDQISLNVNVAVNGELPEDAALKVTKVTNKDEHYADYEKALKAQADQDHYLNNAYSIYDYALMSHDQKIALPAEATITMTYSQPYAPAMATNEDEVSLYRLSSPIKDLTKETDTKLVMSDNTNKVTSLTYKTDTLDPIALTYREKKQSLGNVKVHYVDEKDPTKALADTQTLSASSLNGALNFDTLSKALADNDKTSYTYKRTLFNNNEIAGAKVEKKNDLSYFYYVAKDGQDYTPYKGEGETFDVDLYFVYEVNEKQDTADQLVNKENDTADELINKTKSKDTSDELTKKQETSAKEEKDTADQLTKKTETKETEKSSSQSSKAEEKDTADQLTAASDTKDTADQLTSSTKDTADQTTAKDTADQVKDNTSSKSTSTKKAVPKRSVLKAPAATYTRGYLKIVDKFAENGRIEASYSATIPDSATNIKYTWYRTKNRKEKKVTRKNTAGTYNIHYDESQANYVDLSADEGNETFTKSDNISYKAVLSFTYNGQEYPITSDSWNLRYFGQLENGSFENPVISVTTKYNWPGNEYINSPTGYAANYKKGDANAPTDTVNGHLYRDGGHYSPDTIWKTTSDWRYRSGGQFAGTDIEIVNARYGSGYQDAYRMRYRNYSGAKDGYQFAELNAESAGALYQDVMTHPGQPMNYWLSHQARTKYSDSSTRGQYANSMYLVIAPLKEVKNITTQEQLVAFINAHGGYDGSIYRYADNSESITYNRNGILIRKIVSDNNGWHDISHLDGYTPTSSATRFFFVAAGTADTDKTVGNFLDRVGFSQKLPEPSQDQFNLQVSKTITGLTGEQIANLAKDQEHPLTLTLTNNSESGPYEKLNNLKLQFMATKTSDDYTFKPISVKGNEVKEVGPKVAVKKDEKKSITLNWTFVDQQIDEKTYQFKVTETDPKLDGYNVTTTNSAENQEGTEPFVTKEINVKKGSNVAFRFSNLYEKLANLTITKHVTGNQADFTKAFKFKLTIKNLRSNRTFTINKINAESNNPGEVSSNDQGEATTWFYLKNGQSISINKLILANEDASYEITEENGSYQASYQIDNGSSVSSATTGEMKINGDDHTIAFTNTKNGEIPTGTQKNAVFTFPLLIAGIGFVLTILKKKNDTE